MYFFQSYNEHFYSQIFYFYRYKRSSQNVYNKIDGGSHDSDSYLS